MSGFLDIGAVADIPRQQARLVKVRGGCIAIFRNAEDRIFALDDTCPHKGGPLSNGIQHGESVTCPLHGWVFDLTTGQALGADSGSVRTYKVTVQDGRILLDRAALAARIAAA